MLLCGVREIGARPPLLGVLGVLGPLAFFSEPRTRAIQGPSETADRGKLSKVLADGDLVVAGRTTARIVFA